LNAAHPGKLRAGKHSGPEFPVSKTGSRFLLPGLILCCLLTACAAARHGTPLPEGSVIINGVPFFEQEDYQCGPASFAAVVNYWYRKGSKGRTLSLEEAVARTYSPSARGVLGIDLEINARKLGFKAVGKAGTIEAVRHSVDQGAPVIILVDYGFLIYQRNHFMVVIGYGPDFVIVNSGRQENEIISNDDLVKIWKRTGCWSLFIEPSS